jgi:hypothetical protein
MINDLHFYLLKIMEIVMMKENEIVKTVMKKLLKNMVQEDTHWKI